MIVDKVTTSSCGCLLLFPILVKAEEEASLWSKDSPLFFSLLIWRVWSQSSTRKPGSSIHAHVSLPANPVAWSCFSLHTKGLRKKSLKMGNNQPSTRVSSSRVSWSTYLFLRVPSWSEWEVTACKLERMRAWSELTLSCWRFNLSIWSSRLLILSFREITSWSF